MKKLVSTLFFLMILAVGVSTAQERERAPDKNLAMWSFGIKGGLDYFRVEPYAVAPGRYWAPFWKDYSLQASWAVPFVFVEYTATHWFGVGLELGWLHYNRGVWTSTPLKGNPDIMVPTGVYYGHTADALLYGSVNLTNLVAPYRKGGWRRISLYINGGFGGGWYHYRIPGKADSKGNVYKKSGNNFVCNGGENAFSFMGMASITTAFNVSKVWELFIEGQYRSYTKEDMGGFDAPGHSLDALALLIGVRWKVGAGGKKSEKEHIRNDLLQDNGSELLAAAKAPKQDPAENEGINKKLAELEGRVKDLENANNAGAPGTDGVEGAPGVAGAPGTVPDGTTPSTKPKVNQDDFDNAIRNLQKQIDELKKGGVGTTVSSSLENVRFKTDSHELTPESRTILDRVYSVLSQESWSTLEVIGNTDSRASEAYNQRLSEARANEVKRYLVEKGLDAAKIKPYGKGENNPIASNDTEEGRYRNRRVDFVVIK